MRILKIELENLNSLKGYWCIDLTNQAYKNNHDVFVIHGATGAGKTTILDAITLALYGRTPRQSKVDNRTSGNELMTRTTGSCMARITYQCKKGRFTSEFYQARAGKKAQGNLQQPECKICDEDNNIIWSGIPSALAEQTAKLIKLDYGQFCRSIMLAQGEFDRFIKSEGPKDSLNRERAEILAKLNGTEKYKAIGEAVYAHYAAAENDFNNKKKEKEDFAKRILSPEILQQKLEEKSRLEKENKGRKAELDKINEKINWLKELEKSVTKAEEAQKQLEAAEAEIKAFEPQKKLMENGQKAAVCKGAYENVRRQEEDIQKKQKLQTELEQKKTELSKQFDALTEEMGKAQAEKEELKKRLTEQRPLWDEIKKLDAEIILQKQTCADDKRWADEKKQEILEVEQTLKAVEEEYEENKTENDKVLLYLKENQKDGSLEALIPGLKALKQQNYEAEIEKIEVEENISAKKKALQKAEEEVHQLEEQKKQLEQELQAFISREFLSITEILRGNLKKGASCPVCGSMEHPSCTQKTAEKVSQEKAAEVSSNAAVLSQKLEEVKNSLSSLNEQVMDLKNQLKLLESTREKAAEKMAGFLQEAAQLTAQWNTEFTLKMLTAQLEEFITAAAEKSLKYVQAKERSIEIEKALKSEEATKKSFAEQKKTLEKESQKLEAAYKKADSVLKSSLEQRKQKFSDKEPGQEEKKQTEALNSKEEELKVVQEKVQAAQKELVENNAALTALVTGLKELTPRLEKAGQELIKMFEENGIKDEKQYCSMQLEESVLKELVQKQQELAERLLQDKTVVKQTNKEMAFLRKQNKAAENYDQLLQEQSKINDEYSEAEQKLGAIQEQLTSNENQTEVYNKFLKDYEKSERQHKTWSAMKEITGVKDGSDLSAYVESIVFKNLLQISNRYLYEISGKYRLQQKKGKVDFDVYDEKFDETRPVSNMSGGEKFIISLSLALGIAEMASSSVSVDSLFLDEGFGTLSGEPLTEAINALKSLQSSGKMIGIITHVDRVINEFDQKIEVRPVAGGYSMLKGDGITSAPGRQ